MNFKHLSLLVLMALITACGNKGGGSASGSPPHRNDYRVETCEVKFDVSDDLQTVAMKAHEARVNCELSEEEVIKLVEKSI